MSTASECPHTVAYVFITTELGMALDVACMVSDLRREESDARVLWADVVTGPCDVIAVVEVSNDEVLGDFVVQQIQTVPGVKSSSTQTQVVSAHYIDGARKQRNGYP